jgi:hypothetical protein
MPPRQRLRPLKAWRYVGVYGPEVMVCVGQVRIGPARQAFWAVWDRRSGRLWERTLLGRRSRSDVRLSPGRVIVHSEVEIDLRLEEAPGVETVCASGESYAWTRKQGGIRAVGRVRVDGRALAVDSRGVIDDTAAYYERHVSWQWSAGVGVAVDGRAVAWNLVAGVNDPPRNSERTVWADGVPSEAEPSAFAPDLSSVDGLRFESEATRERRENFILVRSRYRQPFGTFSGTLPGGLELAEGYGVMEEHDVWW